MTTADHNAEYAYRYNERLSLICESSAHKGGQRPATDEDREQAKREAIEAMEALEAQEKI